MYVFESVWLDDDKERNTLNYFHCSDYATAVHCASIDCVESEHDYCEVWQCSSDDLMVRLLCVWTSRHGSDNPLPF